MRRRRQRTRRRRPPAVRPPALLLATVKTAAINIAVLGAVISVAGPHAAIGTVMRGSPPIVWVRVMRVRGRWDGKRWQRRGAGSGVASTSRRLLVKWAFWRRYGAKRAIVGTFSPLAIIALALIASAAITAAVES